MKWRLELRKLSSIANGEVIALKRTQSISFFWVLYFLKGIKSYLAQPRNHQRSTTQVCCIRNEFPEGVNYNMDMTQA